MSPKVLKKECFYFEMPFIPFAVAYWLVTCFLDQGMDADGLSLQIGESGILQREDNQTSQKEESDSVEREESEAVEGKESEAVEVEESEAVKKNDSEIHRQK